MTTYSRGEVLRALANLLQKHREIPAPCIDSLDDDIYTIRFQLTFDHETAATKAAAIVRAIGGSFTKDYVGDDGEYLIFTSSFCGVLLEINTRRADVCVARQVGTKTITKKDATAVAALPDIEVDVPVYEYDCKPILAGVA